MKSMTSKHRRDTLDEFGCGVLHYGSGTILAIINHVDGIKSCQFFDDSTDKDEPAQILAGFSFGGVGFANYRSGKQRLVLTTHDVLVAGEDGDILQHYVWDKHCDTTPLPHPIELLLNPTITLKCSSRANVQIIVFELGRIIVARNVGGSLELDISRPSLIQRQIDRQSNVDDPTKKAQKYNWHLPRVSASGREVDKVKVRTPLQNVIESNKALVHRLKTYTSSIGINVQDQIEQQRQIPLHSFFSPIKRHQSYIPSAKVPKPKYTPKTLPRIHPKYLDQMVSRMKPQQLLVVLCSNMSTSDCVKAEKMLAKIEASWAIEDASYDTKFALGNPIDEVASTINSQNQSTNEDPAPNRSYASKRIVLADCSTSNVIGNRHNFSVYPMFLMYFGGQLGFCSNTFNGFGHSEEDFMAQVGQGDDKELPTKPTSSSQFSLSFL
ncbi:hypothetical protein THRCLA_09403 [Thraustotheca clavata]|uniref:FAM194 C-terminal domain-containing protein n=1 Tax=Thraustotheca clavata TaxID=74557 RepID=A0A1V9YWV5_9STRA|nr:hypothetical protein THRCLA_09403 [Thraustotheca clavata]